MNVANVIKQKYFLLEIVIYKHDIVYGNYWEKKLRLLVYGSIFVSNRNTSAAPVNNLFQLLWVSSLQRLCVLAYCRVNLRHYCSTSGSFQTSGVFRIMVWDETLVTSRVTSITTLGIMVTRKSVFWKYIQCFLLENVCAILVDCVVALFFVVLLWNWCYVWWSQHRQGAKVSEGKRRRFRGWERNLGGEPVRTMAQATGRGKSIHLFVITLLWGKC